MKCRKIFILSVIIAVLLTVAVGIYVIYPEYKYKTYLRLGDKYYGELNFEDAELSYKKAFHIRERRKTPYLKLADLYLAEGETDDAENIIRTGIKYAGEADIFQEYLDNIGELAEASNEVASEKISVVSTEDSEITPEEKSELYDKTVVGQLGVLDRGALNYTIRNGSRNKMRGGISSYMFTQNQAEYEWMISMNADKMGTTNLYYKCIMQTERMSWQQRQHFQSICHIMVNFEKVRTALCFLRIVLM